MDILKNLSLNIYEVLALIGLVQCVMVLVYLIMRIRHFVREAIPLIYFFTLATALFLEMAESSLGDTTIWFESLLWLFWFVVLLRL